MKHLLASLPYPLKLVQDKKKKHMASNFSKYKNSLVGRYLCGV